MGLRYGPQAGLIGATAGALGGGFAGIATSAYGGSGATATAVAGMANSMMRNGGSVNGNIMGGMAGGTASGAINALTSGEFSADASIVGGMAGAVAGGAVGVPSVLSSVTAIAGGGLAAGAGAIVSLFVKSWTDSAVNSYCQAQCGP